MNTAVSKFEQAEVPAFFRAPEGSVTNALAALASAAFPYLSIKGKRFAVVRNKEETIIMRPDDDDTPANSIEVVLINAATVFSKVFYAAGYVDGSKEKPTCYSNDGQAPAADAADKQSKKCATCEHNAWGSSSNGKGKACSDSLRFAIAKPDELNDPMLLRVPPASLKNATEYAAMLARKGAPMEGVVTKVKFDPAEATPKLIFTPVRFLNEKGYQEALDIAKSNLVQQIIGSVVVAAVPQKEKVIDEDTNPEAVAEAKKAVEKAKEEPRVEKPKKPAGTAKTSDLAAKLKASMADDNDD